jgi:putative toxin-antitoxin system antitoxin component (TIGR02293 family)
MYTSQFELIAGILGLKQRLTPLLFVDEVERGLPFASLARVFDAVAPDEPHLRYVVVSRATYARKKSERTRLSREQSDHVTRVARVWVLALDVWKTPEGARAFLVRPHPLLEGRRPIDVTLTTEGARLVEGILGRLSNGSAA